MCRPAPPGAETFGLGWEGLGIRPPVFSVYPVSRGGGLKPAGGKPAETGWRLFGVGLPGPEGPGYDPPVAGEAV